MITFAGERVNRENETSIWTVIRYMMRSAAGRANICGKESAGFAEASAVTAVLYNVACRLANYLECLAAAQQIRGVRGQGDSGP
jgi:hypothetical protein